MIEKLPIPWVERIFERLECIYKEKWRKSYGDPKIKDIAILQWSAALTGLNAKEIQKAITTCECYMDYEVPTFMEFFDYAKGKRAIPNRRPNPMAFFKTDEQKKHGEKYINEIKAKLKGSST